MTRVECAFCNNPEVEKRIIYKDEIAWSFPTNTPIVPGHILICPVRCVAKLDDLSSQEVLAIARLTKKVKKALVEIFGAEGFNFAWNEGEVAGQSVPHLHLHVLPRKSGDFGITEYEPRKFLYRPGSREVSPEEELKNVSLVIREALLAK